LRHPVYGNEKNIRVRAPIDFVTIYKNEPNANKWIFDERGAEKCIHRESMRRGGHKSGWKIEPSMHMHVCAAYASIYMYIYIECPKTVAMFLSMSFLNNLGLSVIKM